MLRGDDFDGVLTLSQTFRIYMREMASWSPERITQLFDGLALMIEAARDERPGGHDADG